ncbi:T9SS type A sorting domain-containing protein [Hymenobacter sp. BT770]|uniref:T9SS type A sorting domain-containing protein n=1 Tax=Hymenobacter sp. BT770 TaxID=2886942 RepID=UPI001D11D627|nr:T9SS type A sorting domain-containing protein [Hymenobacter sp. BT770]MCC3152313.1 T9SS type A sorting domain-containing protein [Hymenobacter sp. BT770]MDO3414126.1 T9SS type A sorting domain-containing protein [Hymenobacter sp. BT770]
MKKLLLTLLSVMPLAGWAQTLTQADFTGVLVPQYLSNGNNSATTGATAFPGPRLAVVFRATLTNLTPSTLYRYYVQAATQTDIGGTASGAGVLLMVNPGATTAATTYLTTSTGSLTTTGQFATFTTNAAGSYTGWFAYVNSNNATRFQVPGMVLFPTITLATDATPATIVARRALDQSMTLLGFINAAGANNGTLLTGSSSATPKNLVFTYDNAAGTGRPLSGALVENAGVVTGTTQAGAAAYTYSTTDGSYTTVLPNTLPNGLRRVEQRSIVDNSIVGCASDADGVWPSGANTVNPTGGPGAAIVLTSTDTPLNTNACSTVSATNPGNALPGLTISPNPATDRITVALPQTGAATVALRDLTGRSVLAPAALGTDHQLRLPAGLAAGTYLLEVRQGAVTAVRRVQKN